MHTLNQLGWDWRENGAVISFVVDGAPVAWFVPLQHVRLVFGEELAAVGCPLAPSVGDPPSVGGFFRSISRGIKRASRSVKRKVRKSVPKAIRRAARKVQRAAVDAYKTGSGIARQGLAAAKGVPGLGSLAQLGTSALDIQDRFLTSGRLPSGRQLTRLAKSGAFAAADFAAPGSSTLARGALKAGRAVASGKRLDRALASGALSAASGYIPGGAAGQHAFAAARDLASGKRLDKVIGRRLKAASKLKGLRGLVPDGQSMTAARRAWSVAKDAQKAARRVKRGITLAQDAAAIARGENATRGIAALVQRAKRGDPAARRFLAALKRVR